MASSRAHPEPKAFEVPAPTGRSPHVSLPNQPAQPAPPPPAPAAHPHTRERRVVVVTPCYNAPGDLELVLTDLARLDLAIATTTDDRNGGGASRVRLRVLVVDNASDQPLDRVPVPAGLQVEFLRLDRNRGGSGGYNAGMAHALATGVPPASAPEFLWLLDADARPTRGALVGLIEALDAHQEFAAMGSSIADPDTGEIFEIGGRLDRCFGTYRPAFDAHRPPPGSVADVTYAAACSLLVRTETARRAGPMPDVFLNGDDIEWCIRLRQRTGMRIGATTDSVVRHPRFARAGQTRTRYLMARNGLGPIEALGGGARMRLMRALRELPRALAQVAIQREDLAALHLRGLADAAAGRTQGRGALDELEFEPFHPFTSMPGQLREHAGTRAPSRAWLHPEVRLARAQADELARALEAAGIACPPIPPGAPPPPSAHSIAGVLGGAWRLVRGPRAELAIIPAHGRASCWARGRTQVQVAPNGLVVRRFSRRRLARAMVSAAARGLALSRRIMLGVPSERPTRRPSWDTLDARNDPSDRAASGTPAPGTARE